MKTRTRLLSAIAVFVAAIGLIAPFAFTEALNNDEDQYIWSAAHFGGKVARLEFGPDGTDDLTDPGWSPALWWSLTQPMGTRLLYAATLGISAAEAPRIPNLPHYPDYAMPETHAAPGTLLICRLAGVAAAALGSALIAWRIGPRALIVVPAFLATWHVRVEFALAWAEGPLLLGFGLCLLAYRTRWFAVACGLAATFKLTALGLWPLVLLPGANGSVRRSRAMLATVLVWTALTPPSWFAYGPFYLVNMAANRVYEFGLQKETLGGADTFYFPLRYLWPFELAVFLGCLWLSRRAARALERRRHAAPTSGGASPQRYPLSHTKRADVRVYSGVAYRSSRAASGSGSGLSRPKRTASAISSSTSRLS